MTFPPPSAASSPRPAADVAVPVASGIPGPQAAGRGGNPPQQERTDVRNAAERVVEIYYGLAEDANDGEFALWSQTDLIVAIVALARALAVDEESA